MEQMENTSAAEETTEDADAQHSKARWVALGVASAVAYVVVAMVVVWFVSRSGTYPAGSDTMYHIHRTELVYNGIRAGNWWPGYDPTWYNGVEIMRYWPPLAPYLMAACQAIASGDIWMGYLIFVGVLVVGSGLPWLYIGFRMRRPWLGAFIGLVWFFLPNNLYQLFAEGNIPRALSMCFLPLFAYNVAAFLKDERRPNFVGISVTFALMVLCHLGYAGMLALATLLFSLVYCLVNRRIRVALRAVLAMLIGFLLVGVWLVPSLFGGISNIDSSTTMRSFFQSLGVSLNPLARLRTNLVPYIGLPGFVLAVIGSFFSSRDAAPGFITAALTCVLTSTAAMPFLAALPGGGLLWMMRFVSIALCLTLISLLQWRCLKTPILVAFCTLVVLDCIPSLSLVYGNQTGEQPVERMTQQQRGTLVEEAKHITTQRMCVLQEGSGVVDAYVLTNLGGTTNQVFGAGWEASTTSRNILLLNRASNEGDFLYMFDRAKELGADTVLMRTDVVEHPKPDMIEQLDECAKRVGFELVNTSGVYRLYHLASAPSTFGVKTQYPAIAIGKNSDTVALDYPAFKQTSDPNLNHYTYDELSQYRVVYLRGSPTTTRRRRRTWCSNSPKAGFASWYPRTASPRTGARTTESSWALGATPCGSKTAIQTSTPRTESWIPTCSPRTWTPGIRSTSMAWTTPGAMRSSMTTPASTSWGPPATTTSSSLDSTSPTTTLSRRTRGLGSSSRRRWTSTPRSYQSANSSPSPSITVPGQSPLPPQRTTSTPRLHTTTCSTGQRACTTTFT
ncbi:MAG: 6-pyruvoyl-tetrahydropterin synthase-related protein [Olsenella sp.]|jgi:uncharacterized membrane protein|nr:6-pyruvoyl-tetrahydropterin synthase-related protein [Olsenella sp.]